MNKKTIKLAAAIVGVLVLLAAVVLFFFFGGFKLFEKNRAKAELYALTAYIEEKNGTKLCEAGSKGLDPLSGSSGDHSYYYYYQVQDHDAISVDLKNIAETNGYDLEPDDNYINNLRKDASNSKSTPRDRKGVIYNAESEYLTARNQVLQSRLKVRFYRNSPVVLTCLDDWPQQLPETDKVIVYMYVNGVE